MRSTRSRIVTPLLVALVLAASGSAAAARHGKGALVQLRATSLGRVLVDSRGFALYLYTPDPAKRSVCYGTCAAAWPPLLTSAKPSAGKGLRTKLLGTTRRKDGRLQVTYAGHPLYFYIGDAKAGQTNGQNVGGIWYVLNAAGKQVSKTAPAADSSGTTTAPPPDAGYGY